LSTPTLYHRTAMEWIGKVNATGTYEYVPHSVSSILTFPSLFVPCANCNDGAPCQTEAFRMSEFLNLAYHPGCLGCQEKGIPCPDNSHTGGALWTLGTSDEMDEGWEDGEANKVCTVGRGDCR
jgi:hypothetical protein